MNRPFSIPFAFCVVFAHFFPVCFEAAVEQTFLIDLAKRHSANGQQFEEVEGVENLLTIKKGVSPPKRRQTAEIGTESPEPLRNKLEEMISSLHKMFSQRFDQLSKRIERMEANQRNFMKGSDWAAVSEGKRIRLSTEKRNWLEARNFCSEMNSSLLEINPKERRNIGELLKSTADSFLWAGIPTTQFPHKGQNELNRENFVNTEERQQQQQIKQMCTAITVNKGGQNTERECDEKHKFICQI